MSMNQEGNKQLEAANSLLLDMVKSQKENAKHMFRAFVVTVCCLTILLIAMIVGFFIYESQFEVTDTITAETTVTQEVSGDDSTINNVEGNQCNDNATHNENE